MGGEILYYSQIHRLIQETSLCTLNRQLDFDIYFCIIYMYMYSIILYMCNCTCTTIYMYMQILLCTIALKHYTISIKNSIAIDLILNYHIINYNRQRSNTPNTSSYTCLYTHHSSLIKHKSTCLQTKASHRLHVTCFK